MEQPSQGAYANERPYWDHRTGETFFGPRAPVVLTRDQDDSLYVWRSSDSLEAIAFREYGTPELAWLIADVNDVVDPFLIEVGTTLQLPSRARVELRTLG